MKKVAIGAKPSASLRPTTPDDWVENRAGGNEPKTKMAPDEPTKRLTIDIPASLHAQVKSQCALQNLRMADVVREMLEKRFQGEGVKSASDRINHSSANTETQKHE
jgi:hypothetical protein